MRLAIKALFIGLILIFLVSCLVPNISNFEHGDNVISVGRIGRIEIDVEADKFTSEEVAQINSAISFYIDAWKKDNKYRIVTRNIVVIKGDNYHCQPNKDSIYGCNHLNERTIYVADRDITLWSIYHELCHLLPGGDVNHENPEWEAWSERRESLVNEWKRLSRKEQ